MYPDAGGLTPSPHLEFFVTRVRRPKSRARAVPRLAGSHQVDREDATGRSARDLRSEERRLRRPLTMLNNRADFRAYVSALPRGVGVTKAEALAMWNEWVEARTPEHSTVT